MSIRYIFSINAGRSGSEYLAKLFSHAVNVVSLHEATPLMNGWPMEQFNNGDETALRALMSLKMREIRRYSMNGRKIYCETNHSFIKGWGTLLPDAYISQQEMAVIIIQREAEDVADSLLRVHDVPGASLWSRTWYLIPGEVHNLSAPPKNANAYELCLWCVHEINMRTKAYQQRFPYITYLECNLEQLNDYQFVVDLMGKIGLTPGKGLKEIVGHSTNLKDEWPRLSRSELLETASLSYPSADGVIAEQRIHIGRAIIDWLWSSYPEDILALQRNYSQGGTLLPAVIGFVVRKENQIEQVFRYQLRFSEMERILIYELLYSLDPKDIAFAHIRRSVEPELHYVYDYNRVMNAWLLFRMLGWRTCLRILRILLLGHEIENKRSSSLR